MKALLTSLLFILAGAACAQSQEVSFLTEDGVRVFGDWYGAGVDKGEPVILLFHQGGGDARGEYADIAPRLVANGFHVLAIDQRNGGDVFQSTNRTIGHMGADYVEPGYCEAYPDLIGALRYVRKQNYAGKLIAWGSSYSAALVFRLAAENPSEISGLLAFSPAAGPPLADCPLAAHLDLIKVPAVAFRPAREYAIESVAEQMKQLAAAGVETYVADPGVHGSSMLNARRVKASTEDTWQVVLSFLSKVKG